MYAATAPVIIEARTMGVVSCAPEVEGNGAGGVGAGGEPAQGKDTSGVMVQLSGHVTTQPISPPLSARSSYGMPMQANGIGAEAPLPPINDGMNELPWGRPCPIVEHIFPATLKIVQYSPPEHLYSFETREI